MSRLRLLGHMNYITYSLATVFMLGSLLLLSLSQECFGILSLSDIEGVCEAISERISGRVYYPDSRGINYMSGLYHYISSSSESSACVLEANSTTDVAIALQSIAANRVPFGIKSGGHASNLGFSSTSGILISLTRLNRIEIARDRTSVRVGTGNVSSFAKTMNSSADMDRCLQISRPLRSECGRRSSSWSRSRGFHLGRWL